MTILAMGDSTTAGTPAFRSPVEVPPDGAGDSRSQYTYWVMKKRPQWRLLNRGVNGERSDEIMSRLPADLKQFKPQVVVLLAGVNDLYQGLPPERIEKNLETMYAEALKSGARVIACTVLPYNGSSALVQSRMDQLNGWIKEYAAQHGLGFCDTHAAVADPARAGRLLSSADGYHPDVEGYRRMGEAVAAALEGSNG